MAAPDPIDVLLVGEIADVESKREFLAHAVSRCCIDNPVAFGEAAAVVDIVEARPGISQPASEVEALPKAIIGPEVERMPRRVAELTADSDAVVRARDPAAHESIGTHRLKTVRDVPCQADFHAVHGLSAVEYGWRIPRIDAGGARVGLLRPEECGVGGQTIHGEIPFGADFEALAPFGFEVCRGCGETFRIRSRRCRNPSV